MNLTEWQKALSDRLAAHNLTLIKLEISAPGHAFDLHIRVYARDNKSEEIVYQTADVTNAFFNTEHAITQLVNVLVFQRDKKVTPPCE